jgi:hypothetical protein
MKRAPVALAAPGALLVALLAAPLVTSPSLAGESDADFAASKGSAAEAQLKERQRAAVRTIPGTDTQYLVGGYLQLDGIATRKRQDGDEQNTFFASSIPFEPAGSDQRLSGRQSQFNWLSRTPTGSGPVVTRLEANLFPLDGTTAVTVNQAFVQWNEYVLVGKTYSTFMDDGALPTTIDYNGPSGVTFVRQWLARGTLKLGPGWALDAAVEEPQANLSAGSGVLGVSSSAERPDLAARVRYESERGHFQLSGLSRRVSASVTSPAGTAERTFDGTGVSVSGSLSLRDDDTLLFQAATGKGVGRYFNDPLSATGLALNADRTVSLLRTSGATLYYQRKWAPDWMTVVGASTLWLSDEGLRPPEALHRIRYASLNLIHRLTATLIVGAETIWGEAIRADGAAATNLRLQLSVRYLIF